MTMRTGFRRLTSIAGFLALGLGGLFATGCDTVPLTAPSDATVTLTTATGVNGSTEVIATVLEAGGTPVQNGTSVRFSTSLGRMEPAEVHTRNSVASSTFIAGDASGEATITVSSGKATATVKLLLGAATVDNVTVRSNSGSVPATGGTVDIIARVGSASGSTIPGIPVTFSTTAGSLSSTREISDGNGEAKTRLTTDANATVTAAAGTKTGTITIQALNPVPTPTVSLTATGGTATSVAQLWNFTATVSNNGAVGLPVQFEWNFGDGTTQQGTSPSTTHAYREELKVFTASVVVRFANGTSVSATADIVTAEFP